MQQKIRVIVLVVELLFAKREIVFKNLYGRNVFNARIKDPVLSIMLHASLNNRRLDPVQTKTVTEAREA